MRCLRRVGRIPSFGRIVNAVVLVTVGAACSPALTPLPAPVPVNVPAPLPVARRVPRVALPARLPSTAWRVTSTTRLSASPPVETPVGVRETRSATSRLDEQQVETRALVSLMFDRTPSGALRGTGQVDSFTVRSTMDTADAAVRQVTATGQEAPRRAPSARLLIDALLDSTVSRVVVRPALGNECDRSEMSAVQLVRELLVRVPDGATVGDQWRDSTVALVCRLGVPITVFTATQSTLMRIDGDLITIRREISSRLSGTGGSAFRALEVTGASTGMQTAELSASRGTLEQLRGTRSTTLTLRERSAPASPRVQRVTQQVELRVERIRP